MRGGLMIYSRRVMASREGKGMAGERWGKFKTVIQMTAVGTIFFVLDVYHLMLMTRGATRYVFEITFYTLKTIPYGITAIAAVITWISAISYLKNNWELLQKSWSIDACKR